MRDDVGLMRAILDDPDDDLPRLAYADWCDESGDPARAEFIRAQLALARRDDPPLRVRAVHLLATNAPQWERALPPVPRPVRYKRGFIEHVEAEVAAEWLMSADAWFRCAPVRSLQLRLPSLMATDAVRRFKRNPGLRLLRSLAVTFPEGSESRLAHPLLDTPFLNGLRHLTLRREGVGNSYEFGRAIAEASMHLERLELPGCIVHLGGLLSCPRLDRLTHLDLRGNQLDPDDAALLAVCPHLGALRHLDLGEDNDSGRDNGLEDEGVANLVRGEGLGSLSNLILNNNGVGPSGIDALLAWPRLANLRNLSLCHNPIGESSIAAIAACRDLAGLRTLDLEGIEGLGPSAALALVQSPHLPSSLILRMRLVDNSGSAEAYDRLLKRFPSFHSG